jgi:hypothetical protein
MQLSPLQLAKSLRAGNTLSFCDSTLSFSEGRVEETHMGYDTYVETHTFHTVRLDWRKVRRWLKSGAYR